MYAVGSPVCCRCDGCSVYRNDHKSRYNVLCQYKDTSEKSFSEIDVCRFVDQVPHGATEVTSFSISSISWSHLEIFQWAQLKVKPAFSVFKTINLQISLINTMKHTHTHMLAYLSAFSSQQSSTLCASSFPPQMSCYWPLPLCLPRPPAVLVLVTVRCLVPSSFFLSDETFTFVAWWCHLN